MKKSLFLLFCFCASFSLNSQGVPAEGHDDGFPLSGHSLHDELLDVLEERVSEESLQLQLARVAVVSEEAEIGRREWAVLQLGARGAKGHLLIEEVQGALIDAVRLPDTPRKVKRAISRHIEFFIADRKDQLEILNWALSYKEGDVDAVNAVSGAVENFQDISADVYLKILELSAAPSVNRVLRLSGLKFLRGRLLQTLEDSDMQSATVDLVFSDQITDEKAVQILSDTLSGFQDPPSEVLLKLAEVAVSPKKIHNPFRRPALNVIEKNIESINGEVQKKLFSGLMRGNSASAVAKRIVRIFRQIPQLDPEVENLMAREVFSNFKANQKTTKPKLSTQLPDDFYESVGIGVGAIATISSSAAFMYSVAMHSNYEGAVFFFDMIGGGIVGGLLGAVTLIPSYWLGVWADDCRKTFRMAKEGEDAL